jgi:hypothetical protein
LLLVALLSIVGVRQTDRWTSCEEVYDLAVFNGQVYAATSAGVVNVDKRLPLSPAPTSIDLPKRIWVTEGRLHLADGSKQTVRLDGTRWIRSESTPAERKQIAPPRGSGGAFLSAATGEVFGFWGSRRLYRSSGGELEPWIDGPPASGIYALIRSEGDDLLAGTPNGLFKRSDKGWTQIELPSDLPFARLHGFARASAGRWVAGGIPGLRIGSPGKWETVSQEPVRQIARLGRDVWVLYGSGAIDKLDVANERLFYDVLHESVKRPWASCLAAAGDRLLIGTEGGWIEKGKDLVERYPPRLSRLIVTAISATGEERWIGTQTQGLFHYNKGSLSHPGSAAVLGDPWVTAVLPVGKDKILVGTASEGLFEVSPRSCVRRESPTMKPRFINLWHGRLVIGGLDGCWVQEGNGWKRLSSDETTGLSIVDEGLWVLTPLGATRYSG